MLAFDLCMQARVTFLGTGTSHGVPIIGCRCAVCRSPDPRDRRTRPSIVVEVDGGPTILVDTSTDLREQCLRQGLSRLDAILFTHGHADHIMGLDDVRRFNALMGGAIPAYADGPTCEDIRRAFSYIFEPPRERGGFIPQLSLTEIDGPFAIGPMVVQPVPLLHGSRPILGFRFGDFAYLTDCSRIPDRAWELLDGLDVLAIDALRHRPHPTHFTVAEAVEAVERIGPRHAYFTHICHDLPHEATTQALPSRMSLAYDGLSVTIDVEALCR